MALNVMVGVILLFTIRCFFFAGSLELKVCSLHEQFHFDAYEKNHAQWQPKAASCSASVAILILYNMTSMGRGYSCRAVFSEEGLFSI